MALGNNSKAPDNNGKVLQCHCAMQANHIIEQRSCFYYPELGNKQSVQEFCLKIDARKSHESKK